MVPYDFNPSISHPLYWIRKGLYNKINLYSGELSGRLLDFGCGGNGDRVYAEAFKEAFAGYVTDLTGATRLPELLTILHRAEALVTVDTGSVHLAAAVGCRVFGIYNGSQYGRFSPYPLDITNKVISIYPTEIAEDLVSTTMIQQKYLYTVAIPYQWVQAKQVIELLNHSFHA